MAKKVVGTLRKSTGKDFAKIVRMERSPKTGAYTFKESIVPTGQVKDFLARK